MPDPFTLLHGDMRDLLPGIPDATYHSCVTDPPYHLGSIVRRFGPTGSKAPKGTGFIERQARGFLGQDWDSGDVAFRPETWEEVRRVVKPGGFLAAFAHETNDDLVKGAIRSAGWEIWGSIPWLYATGSVLGNLALDDGLGTRLKRSHEPVIVARNPLTKKTVRAQVEATGTGALRLDDCRDADGKWPKNLLVSHPQECGETCHPDCPVEELRRQGYPEGTFPAFRYCPKPGPAEKQIGLELLPEIMRRRVNPGGMERDPKWAPVPTRNPHATVKPVSMMRWLVRLVTPHGGRVLDPFGGSGTTGVAAILEGLEPTLIEMLPRKPEDDDYLSVCLARMTHAVQVGEAEGHDLLRAAGEGPEVVAVDGDLVHHSELSPFENVRRQGALHGLEEAELLAWGERIGLLACGALSELPEVVLLDMSERMRDLDTPELLEEVRHE